MKRSERLRTMIEKGLWKEGDDIYGLPKIKTVRIKIKKEKAAEKPEAATTAEGAPAPSPQEQKEPSAAKGSAAKSQDKK